MMNLDSEEMLKQYLADKYYGGDITAVDKIENVQNMGSAVMFEEYDGYYREHYAADILDLITWVFERGIGK